MWVALIASLIISIVAGVDSSVAQTMYKDKVSSLTREANRIATQLAQDESLVNQLMQAETDKNAKLQQNLLMSSPAGARLKAMKDEFMNSNRKIIELRKKEKNIRDEQVKSSAESSQKLADAATSGSAIVDLIAGSSGSKSSGSPYSVENTIGRSVNQVDVIKPKTALPIKNSSASNVNKLINGGMK